MKKIKNVGIAALAAIAPFALLNAEPYNWELGASYVTGDTDINDIDVNEDNLAFDGVYYFKTIDTTGRSLHEAPFLQRSSLVELGVDIEDFDDDLNNVVDTDTYSLNTTLIHPDNGWYLKLGYVDSDANIENPDTPSAMIVGYQPSYDGFSAAVGKYIFQDTTLQLGVTELDIDGDFFIQSGGSSDSDSVGIGFKHYGGINEKVAYSIEANYYFLDLRVADFEDLDDDPFDDSGDVYSITGTLYPMRELAIGLSYTDSDDLMGLPYLTSTSTIQDGLGVSAEWFFTDNFSVHAVYNNQEYDVANFDDIQEPGEVEGDSVLFGAKYRF